MKLSTTTLFVLALMTMTGPTWSQDEALGQESYANPSVQFFGPDEQTGDCSKEVPFVLQVGNNSSVTDTFDLTFTAPSNWIVSCAPARLTIAPHATSYTVVYVRIPTGTPGGRVNFIVYVYDALSLANWTMGHVLVLPPAPGAISVSAGTKETISWGASVGGAAPIQYVVSINGVVVKRTTGTSVVYGLPSGSNRVEVRAMDRVGVLSEPRTLDLYKNPPKYEEPPQ